MRLRSACLVAIGHALTALLVATQAQAQPKPPNLPQPPGPVQPPGPPGAESFFGNLAKKTVANAQALDGWRKDAEAAARKSVADFAGCPSRDAQVLYDQLGRWRQDAITARQAAAAAEQDAAKARQRCLDTPGVPAPSCHAAYNKLPFSAQRNSAQATADAADAARQALKALRCPAGCDKPLTLRVAQANTLDGEPITPQYSVCTAWDPGRLLVRAGVEGDELGAEFKARLPRCSQHQQVALRYCKTWDAAKLVPTLKTLKLLPPEFETGRITVSVPMVDVPVVTGFTKVCRRNETACTQVKGEATVAIDTADPLATLAQISASRCTKRTVLGCSDPPLGLQPTMGKLALPTTTQAKLTWTHAGGSVEARIPQEGYTWTTTWPPVPVPVPQIKASGGRPNLLRRGGSVEFDVSGPDWKSACKQWADVKIPTSRVAFSQRTVPTGLCLSVRLGPVVAKP